jgi:hypothetical protein
MDPKQSNFLFKILFFDYFWMTTFYVFFSHVDVFQSSYALHTVQLKNVASIMSMWEHGVYLSLHVHEVGWSPGYRPFR